MSLLFLDKKTNKRSVGSFIKFDEEWTVTTQGSCLLFSLLITCPRVIWSNNRHRDQALVTWLCLIERGHSKREKQEAAAWLTSPVPPSLEPVTAAQRLVISFWFKTWCAANNRSTLTTNGRVSGYTSRSRTQKQRERHDRWSSLGKCLLRERPWCVDQA